MRHTTFRQSATSGSPNPVYRRLLLLGLIWWTLAGQSVTLWVLGLPFLAAAGWLAAHSLPSDPARVRLARLPRFILYFLGDSLRGGYDVARRALHPHMPLTPRIINYPTVLPEGAPRVLFGNLLSLMPGSLCVDLSPTGLVIHVLAHQESTVSGLAALEAEVAKLFGLPAPPGGRA